MTPLSLDACLDVLADRHRRLVVQQLRAEPDGTMTMDELLDRFCADSGGGAPDRAHLATQLHHTHLPRLADRGLVEYDRATGFVRYRPDDRLERVLDSLPEEATLTCP